MSDPVDDLDALDALIRRAMAILDHQIPEGTFDTLAARTLARLDDPGIGEPLGEAASAVGEGPGPNQPLRDDPPVSSAPAWTAVTWPAPTELEEASGQGDIDELARARALREARVERAHQPGDPVRVPAAVPPVADQAEALSGGRAHARRRSIVSGGVAGGVAVVGLGLAAAVGAMVFVSTRDRAQVAPELAQQAPDRARAGVAQTSPAGTVAANGAPSSAPARPSEGVASGSAPGAAAPAVVPSGAGVTGQGNPGDQVAEIAGIAGDGKAEVAKPVPAVRAEPQLPVTKGGAPTSAPYEPKKQKRGPRKDARSDATPDGSILLSRADIQRGMRAVAARAQACAAGTPDLAIVRLTVAPSGHVQKVTVIGRFAGTSVGSCVEHAVATATFPAWDGEPQSFEYEYVLSP
ncbi:MAG TPA: hypothetical protein VHN14_30025 [Kofleriaceae bacterium]|jgi:hypothetical protein|nr:hypothetical protein [Kofleriaceae bacterium]